MKRPYFICDQVSSRSQSGSGVPNQRSERKPPCTVPYARSLTPCARQSAVMAPPARRSTSENDTWLETMGMPLARAMRRCAVSKLVSPR